MKKTSTLLHRAYLKLIRLNPNAKITSEAKCNMIVESLADGLFNDKFQDKKHTPEEIAMICEKLKETCRERLIQQANKANAEMDKQYNTMNTALNIAYRLT